MEVDSRVGTTELEPVAEVVMEPDIELDMEADIELLAVELLSEDDEVEEAVLY